MPPAPAAPLDSTDRRLLRLLQANNRRRLRDLAEEIGISAPTCLRRMRRLESQGFIRAHSALLDPARLGYGVTAFVEVMLVSASGSEESAFERRMDRCGEVVQCSQVAGEVDYLLTVIARDLPTYAEFMRRHLAEDRRVRSYRSLLVLRQTKSAQALPV
ncbi:MAG TPA: Lrp/AsnC family transcriptional regulator [Steroidobacteraceae bacterium]|nr:Lrp/AsnC family transcriptional regulator [Steroidobacteraceae bacterium]